MFKEIPSSDVITRAIKVYKEFTQSAGNPLTEDDILTSQAREQAGGTVV